jgi:hypothetical protein
VSEGTVAITAPGYGECQVCGCTDDRACPGGCVWANAAATLCSSCALGRELDDEPTHADNLEAAMALGGFEGGVLPTFDLDDVE